MIETVFEELGEMKEGFRYLEERVSPNRIAARLGSWSWLAIPWTSIIRGSSRPQVPDYNWWCCSAWLPRNDWPILRAIQAIPSSVKCIENLWLSLLKRLLSNGASPIMFRSHAMATVNSLRENIGETSKRESNFQTILKNRTPVRTTDSPLQNFNKFKSKKRKTSSSPTNPGNSRLQPRTHRRPPRKYQKYL